MGEISWEGYCNLCGHVLREANNLQLHQGHGPFYLHWLRRSIMASRKRLLAAEACGEGVGMRADE